MLILYLNINSSLDVKRGSREQCVNTDDACVKISVAGKSDEDEDVCVSKSGTGQSVQDDDACVAGVVRGKVFRPLMRA